MKKILVGVALALLTWQCGDKDDKKVTTNKTGAKTCTPNTEKVFAAIQAKINECAASGCHATGINSQDTVPEFNSSGWRSTISSHDDGFWNASNLYKKLGPTWNNHGLPVNKTAASHGANKQMLTKAEAGCQ